MKNKHNKKRNTAFVFEALAREATVAIIKGDTERKAKVIYCPQTFYRRLTTQERP